MISCLQYVAPITSIAIICFASTPLPSAVAAEWTPIQPLNSYALDDNGDGALPVISDQTPSIAASGNKMIAVWGALPSGSFRSDITISRSDASGSNWSPATVIHSAYGTQLPYPQIFNAGPNLWIAAWYSPFGDPPGSTASVYDKFSASTDGGETWSAPATFIARKHGDPNSTYEKYVMAGSSNGTFIKATPDSAAGFSGLSRSFNGTTWLPPVEVPLPQLNHIINTGGNNWFAFDPSTRGAYRSIDNGASWSTLGQVNIPNNGALIENMQSDGNGTIVAVYSVGSSATPAIANTYATYSTDGGATWSPQVVIHSQSENSAHSFKAHTVASYLVRWDDQKWSTYMRHFYAGRYAPLDGNVLISNKLFVSHSTDNGKTWSAAEEMTTSPGWNYTDYPIVGTSVQRPQELFVASDKAIVYSFNENSLFFNGNSTGSDTDNFYRVRSTAPAAASAWELYE